MITRSVKTVQMSGPRQYSEEELDSRRREIPVKINERQILEDEFEKLKKTYKNRIDALNTRIGDIVSQITIGYEVCEQECFEEKDYLARTKRWRSCESGTVIKEAHFRDGDDQMGANEQELRPVPVDSVRSGSA